MSSPTETVNSASHDLGFITSTKSDDLCLDTFTTVHVSLDYVELSNVVMDVTSSGLSDFISTGGSDDT